MIKGLRTISGRGIQTVGLEAAGPLPTDDDTAINLTRSEIERWYRAEGGLIEVAVVPRFALSVTERALAQSGELHDAVRADGVYFHLDIYDGRCRGGGTSLLGPRSVFAHGPAG